MDLNEKYDYKLLMKAEQLEEKAEDDLEFDEDEFMQAYRAKRMSEMAQEKGKPRFGSVYEINKQ